MKSERKDLYLSGKRIFPKPITGREKLTRIVDDTFLAYNAARLREGSRLLVERMLCDDVTVGLSLAGALTPAGLGCSCIVPLIKAGFVDWIVATGANLYHDLHFAFNLPLHAGTPLVDDVELHKRGVVRIYDVFLSHRETLLKTDHVLREILSGDEFQKEMATAELHYLLGKHAAAHEKQHRVRDVSILAAAYRCAVPVYTSSPGDSTIGLIVAERELSGDELRINPTLDVNETAAIVLSAKRNGGKSAAVMLGGGSPKNFILQTEPQIQDILDLEEVGHDYFLQVTDARVDTGGLSGATPHEAVSWGKVDPDRLPDAVVCYSDTTIALPILTHYALANHPKRLHKRLYDHRGQMLKMLTKEFISKSPGRDPAY